jgi:hypothetical protein
MPMNISLSVALVLVAAALVQVRITRLQMFRIPHGDCLPVRFEYCDGAGYAWCAHGELLHKGYTR